MKPINKIKATYYSKEILKYLLVAGMVCVAASSSPFFVSRLIKNVSQYYKSEKYKNSKKKFTSAFNYLKKKGVIEVRRKGCDVYISLTKEGKKRAGKYQIDDLEIQKPKKWDKKWRVVIFDVPASSRMIRDAFRRKLKNFGFYPLQKSIWIYPYSCDSEIKLLRNFFGLNNKQLQVLEVVKLEGDRFFKKYFGLL